MKKVAIARVQGSPKLGINLILTLAFAIVVGFGIQSKTRNIEPKKDQIEKVSVVNPVSYTHLLCLVQIPTSWSQQEAKEMLERALLVFMQEKHNPEFLSSLNEEIGRAHV